MNIEKKKKKKDHAILPEKNIYIYFPQNELMDYTDIQKTFGSQMISVELKKNIGKGRVNKKPTEILAERLFHVYL